MANKRLKDIQRSERCEIFLFFSVRSNYNLVTMHFLGFYKNVGFSNLKYKWTLICFITCQLYQFVSVDKCSFSYCTLKAQTNPVVRIGVFIT